MNDLLKIIGRDQPLFDRDLAAYREALSEAIAGGRFLVIGGAGSIGAAAVRLLFRQNPRLLHVVDLSENNLAELVRDLRSSVGYIDGEFRTFALDCGGPEFDALMAAQAGYDYVLNFSALKHVRSEKDPWTLMRMIQTNIFNTDKTVAQAMDAGAKKYFCVSTDKASNPVNMMGGSKRIMEMYLMRRSEQIPVSSARFANVAFSDGSLPFAWTQRIRKRQPIAAPDDVRRYFVTDEEGGLLCLMSTMLGGNRELFFPKLSAKLHLERFSDLARRYLRSIGYEPVACESEDEARAKIADLPPRGKWPCYFFQSDTTGEKDFEEFYTDEETVDWDRFDEIGVIANDVGWDEQTLDHFTQTIQQMRESRQWDKAQLVQLFNQTLSRFAHKETFKYLDDRM
ncbi:MAG: polysaccharide biosynthesis protein [Phycisphaeraceae bacterium]